MSEKIIIVVLLILAVSVGHWVTLPKTNEDCVLKYIGDAKTDFAAHWVTQSCERKFPKNDELNNQAQFYERALKEFDREVAMGTN